MLPSQLEPMTNEILHVCLSAHEREGGMFKSKEEVFTKTFIREILLRRNGGKKMKERTWFSIPIAILLIVSLLLSGCTQETPEASVEATVAVEPTEPAPTEEEAPTSVPAEEEVDAGPVSGGTLIVGRPNDSWTMDPNDTSDTESTMVANLIAEPLVRIKPGTTEIIPWLAETWEVSDDGLVWTFDLRQGVKFHDGTSFNAEAVEFSFMRMIDPDHPFNEYGTWKMANSMWSYLSEVRALSEYTVEFELDRPWSAFISALAASCRGGAVSPTAVKADPEGFSNKGVSTGPFKVVEWRTDDRVVLERFEDYWGDAPYIDQVIFRVIPENTARLLSLQQGEIHVMYGIDPDIADVIVSTQDLTLHVQPGILHGYLTGNHLVEPWNDIRVRTALFHAINREAIVEAFYGSAEVALGVMSPTLLGFNDELEWPEYDPEKAKQLLAEAGYEDGFSTTLRAISTARTHTPEPLKIAEAIQADLAVVGIEVEIIPMEPAALMANVKAAEHDLELAGFSPVVPDPWTILYTQFDTRRSELGVSNNFSFYRNPEYDALNDLADSTFDPDERAMIYRQMQQIIFRDMVRVDMADVNALFGLREEVQGFVATNLAYMVLDKVWLEVTE